MPKRQYILAVVCYLLIPAVVIASGVLFRLIDPEMARGSADYVRNYRLLELAHLRVRQFDLEVGQRGARRRRDRRRQDRSAPPLTPIAAARRCKARRSSLARPPI